MSKEISSHLIAKTDIDLKALKKESKLIFQIDGKKCSNKIKLFKEFAKKLKFPTYFGYNWDAFLDLMRDLEWMNPNDYNGVVILIKNSDFFLKNEINKNEMEKFRNIVNEIAKTWVKGDFDKKPSSFYIFLIK